MGTITNMVFSRQPCGEFEKWILDSESWESGASLPRCSTRRQRIWYDYSPKEVEKISGKFSNIFSTFKWRFWHFPPLIRTLHQEPFCRADISAQLWPWSHFALVCPKKSFFDHKYGYQSGQKVAILNPGASFARKRRLANLMRAIAFSGQFPIWRASFWEFPQIWGLLAKIFWPTKKSTQKVDFLDTMTELLPGFSRNFFKLTDQHFFFLDSFLDANNGPWAPIFKIVLPWPATDLRSWTMAKFFGFWVFWPGRLIFFRGFRVFPESPARELSNAHSWALVASSTRKTLIRFRKNSTFFSYILINTRKVGCEFCRFWLRISKLSSPGELWT